MWELWGFSLCEIIGVDLTCATREAPELIYKCRFAHSTFFFLFKSYFFIRYPFFFPFLFHLLSHQKHQIPNNSSQQQNHLDKRANGSTETKKRNFYRQKILPHLNRSDKKGINIDEDSVKFSLFGIWAQGLLFILATSLISVFFPPLSSLLFSSLRLVLVLLCGLIFFLSFWLGFFERFVCFPLFLASPLEFFLTSVGDGA